MKIGDKVRFLNAVGGGVVRKFQTKDVVMVEEEDGFETPVLVRECLIVESTEMQVKSSTKSIMEKVEIKPIAESKNKIQEIVELPGGDKLNVYLAFLPIDIKDLGQCNYEVFLVNQSNYFLTFNYMNRENNAWKSRCFATVDPNTHHFIEEFSKEQLNELERVCIQIMANKKNKPFGLKNTYSVELRIDGVKFYKLHCFRENDFFEDEALVYPLIVNDSPERELLVSASDLQEAMVEKIRINHPKPSNPIKKDPKKEILEIDLHINELIDSTAGLSNTELLILQLNTFKKSMEENLSKKGQKIVFIHGKGEGTLRNAIINELKTNYKHCLYQDASFREYGFGATLITIK